jgi:hypothetical protein
LTRWINRTEEENMDDGEADIMARRYIYVRPTSRELSHALRSLGMTMRDFVRITGSDERRVQRWLLGEEDIPVWAGSLMAALGADGARERVDAFITPRIRNQQRDEPP